MLIFFTATFWQWVVLYLHHHYGMVSLIKKRTMKYAEYHIKLEELKMLIAANATGPPSQLAAKLNLSERTLLRMVQQLRDHGEEIRFNKSKKTYESKLK